MDILKRNNPRFCSKYLGFVGTASRVRRSGQPLQVGEATFRFSFGGHSDYQPGDILYIAKRRPTYRGQPEAWDIHKIVATEAYWWYEAWAKRTPKEQRTHPYVPHARTWFGRQTYVVEKL